MTIEKIVIGQFETYGLRHSYFRLDGGAMFGVVPRVIWEKKFAPDRQNRIRLSLNSLLIKTADVLILVDTGASADLDQKFIDYYSIERKPGLIPSLQKLGFEAADINFVVNTHLHFDHCGENTYKNEKGEIVPTFPRAKYIIQKGEWEYALCPSERDKPSYIPQYYLPLEKHGVLELVDGNREISEGVEVVIVPGHTSRHQCVKVSSEGKVLFFLAELVPTSAHIGLPYIMGYDLYPLETLENKKRFFEKAIEEDWILAFDHDPQHFFGKVKKVNNKYIFEPLKI